jgi:hypothetical protein
MTSSGFRGSQGPGRSDGARWRSSRAAGPARSRWFGCRARSATGSWSTRHRGSDRCSRFSTGTTVLCTRRGPRVSPTVGAVPRRNARCRTYRGPLAALPSGGHVLDRSAQRHDGHGPSACGGSSTATSSTSSVEPSPNCLRASPPEAGPRSAWSRACGPARWQLWRDCSSRRKPSRLGSCAMSPDSSRRAERLARCAQDPPARPRT